MLVWAWKKVWFQFDCKCDRYRLIDSPHTSLQPNFYICSEPFALALLFTCLSANLSATWWHFRFFLIIDFSIWNFFSRSKFTTPPHYTFFSLSHLKLLLIFSLYILYTTCIYIYFPSRLLFDLQIVITSLISQQQGRTFRCVCVCVLLWHVSDQSIGIDYTAIWMKDRKEENKNHELMLIWWEKRIPPSNIIQSNRSGIFIFLFSSLYLSFFFGWAHVDKIQLNDVSM